MFVKKCLLKTSRVNVYVSKYEGVLKIIGFFPPEIVTGKKVDVDKIEGRDSNDNLIHTYDN